MKRFIAILTTGAFLQSCMSWAPKPLEPTPFDGAKPDRRVRVTLENGAVLVVKNPFISGDSLVWLRAVPDDQPAGDSPPRTQRGAVACRPFDARRAGTVLGEGAGVLVLEDAGHAARRGARPRAVVSGFGLTCEAFSMVSPEPGGVGVAESVRAALGARSPDSIGWIKAHGTGTRLNDAAEVRGIASVFGTRLTEIPVTSLKPALGHALGASGAVEAVAGLLALEGGFVPPTLGTEHADPELPPCRIALTAEPSDAREALFLSESFGGRCAALAVRHPAAA